jgi:hypothetical protein
VVTADRAACPACDRQIAVRDGRFALHGPRADRCPGSGQSPAPAAAASLVESVERRLAELERRTPGAGTGWQAALALELARDVARSGDETISARTSAAKQLREVMQAIEAASPAEEKGDALDELAQARERRRAS